MQATKSRSSRVLEKPISVTVDDGCKITGLGRTKFYELIAQGKIKTATVGRRRLAIYSSLEELIDTATTGALNT